MNLSTLVALIGEIVALVGFAIPIIIAIKKIIDGQRCQLRSEMLKTYYNNRHEETIHQFEFENFIMLYEAYKALKGNSFIDKIYKEVTSWEVIP